MKKTQHGSGISFIYQSDMNDRYMRKIKGNRIWMMYSNGNKSYIRVITYNRPNSMVSSSSTLSFGPSLINFSPLGLASIWLFFFPAMRIYNNYFCQNWENERQILKWKTQWISLDRKYMWFKSKFHFLGNERDISSTKLRLKLVLL
jgi:hypothetical protein